MKLVNLLQKQKELIQTSWHNFSLLFWASVLLHLHRPALTSMFQVVYLWLVSRMFFPQPLNSGQCLIHGCLSSGSCRAFKWNQCSSNRPRNGKKAAHRVICYSVCPDILLLNDKPGFPWLLSQHPCCTGRPPCLHETGDTGLGLWPRRTLSHFSEPWPPPWDSCQYWQLLPPSQSPLFSASWEQVRTWYK